MPSQNTKETLFEMVKSLDSLPDNELRMLGEKGKNKKDELEKEEVDKLHKKHQV